MKVNGLPDLVINVDVGDYLDGKVVHVASKYHTCGILHGFLEYMVPIWYMVYGRLVSETYSHAALNKLLLLHLKTCLLLLLLLR